MGRTTAVFGSLKCGSAFLSEFGFTKESASRHAKNFPLALASPMLRAFHLPWFGIVRIVMFLSGFFCLMRFAMSAVLSLEPSFTIMIWSFSFG